MAHRNVRQVKPPEDEPAPPSIVGAIEMVEEMQAHLEAIRVASRGNLKRQLEALYLLAIEREQLAAVGYGGDGIRRRIASLEADEETRGIVDRALRWASRDERTHAVLARGLLLQARRRGLAIGSLMANLGGYVAGWSAAVVQHTRFRKAPLSQIVARVVIAFGKIAGKVPETAAEVLDHQSFAEFCRFQVGAERTAVLSWDALAKLLASDQKHERYAPIAARIANDERKHERVLRVLLDTFDDRDRMREGKTAEALGAALTEIDPAFVHVEAGADLRARVGKGGAVHVRHDPACASASAAPEGLRALLGATLEASELAALPLEGAKVAIKTMFMMGYDKRDPSSHVDLVLAEELAVWLRERGAVDVAYLEAPNHFDRFFANRTVADVACYLGFESPHYRVVDIAEDQSPHSFRRGLGQESVCKSWVDADVRIVFGKMRTHPSMLVHLTVSALESLGRRIDELLFFDRVADLATGLMMIVDAFPPDFALLDATHHVADGLTGILGDPTPCHPGRLYAARDPVALDIVAARHMGIERIPDDSVLAFAVDWFDDPRPHIVVDGPDDRIAELRSPHRNDVTIFLSTLAYPVYMFSGDRGNLWVPVMDGRAFPLARSETFVEWISRRVLRALFGFGRPPR